MKFQPRYQGLSSNRPLRLEESAWEKGWWNSNQKVLRTFENQLPPAKNVNENLHTCTVMYDIICVDLDLSQVNLVSFLKRFFLERWSREGERKRHKNLLERTLRKSSVDPILVLIGLIKEIDLAEF